MAEKICTIPLRDAFETVRTKRSRRAVQLIREYARRHMKVPLESVRISAGVNSSLLEHNKPPRRVKVKIATDDKGLATVWLLDEQEKLAAAKKKLEEAKKAKDERNKKSQEAAKKKAEAKPAAATPAAQPAQKPATQPAKPAQ